MASRATKINDVGRPCTSGTFGTSGSRFALADEGVTMSYKYRTVRVRGTELVGTIARKHGSAAEIYETSKDPSTSVVPVFFEATGEIRFFDRSVLEDVVAPAS